MGHWSCLCGQQEWSGDISPPTCDACPKCRTNYLKEAPDLHAKLVKDKYYKFPGEDAQLARVGSCLACHKVLFAVRLDDG